MAAKPDRPKLRMKYKGTYHAPIHGPEKDLDKELSIPAKEIGRRSPLRSNPSNTTTRRLKSKSKPSSETETSRALYESVFPGWAASTLPTGLAARRLLQEALIPSPLSENAWAKLERQRKNAWMDVVDHTSSGTRALYHYIREKLPDVDNRIFGGREFPLQCREGLICNLIQEDTSADHGCYVNSHDTEDDPTSMLRTRWINGDYMIPLDSKAGIGKLQESADGRSPQGAATSIELRRLHLLEDEQYGFFIVNTRLAPLFINGISIGMNMVAGPLPDFAVIEVGDLTLFWWCTLKGVDFIPRELPTGSGGELEGSKRYLGDVDGYEDFNNIAPSVKRPRFDEGVYVAASNSFGFPPRDAERANKKQGTRGTNDHGSSATPQPEGDRSTQKVKDTLPLPSSWKDDYHRRMEACKARAKTDVGKDTPWAVHRLSRTESLVSDDVFLPIAAVWYGLVQQNIRFAFGTKALFERARSSQARGMVCVLSPNNFIMPLIFDGAENATSKSSQTVEAKPMRTRSQYRKLRESAKASDEAGLTSEDIPLKPTVKQPNQSGSHAERQGHGILVVAERSDSSNKGESVTLTCFDSRSDLNNHDRVRRAARNLVQNSRWTKERPTWTGESWPAVAQQRDGNLAPMASGVHVVLNAWAYMLNIPLSANPRLSEKFYAKARKVIKAAVKGGLDSETIRAFMQTYRYAVPQDLAATQQCQEAGNSLMDGLRLMRSVYMNEQIFDDIIDRLQRRERGESIDRDDDAPPGDGGGSTGPRKGPPRVVKPGSKGDRGVPEEDPSDPEINPPPPGGDPSDPGEGPRRPASWEAILNDGLRHHSQLYEQWRAISTLQHEARTCINRTDDLEDDSVVLAIASLWEALRQARITFSFGTVNSFRFYRSSEDRHQSRNDTMVHAQRPLVMPLLFHVADDREDNEDESGKGKGKGKRRDIGPTDRNASSIGHFVLATAERNGHGQVQITVRNSGPRHLGRDHAARIARSFVTYSGWMGIGSDGNQLPANPDFAPVAHHKVPVQRCGNTCGLYVILNAWAYMLGVPVRREREATRNHTHSRFHAMALEIINLALAGFMDSLTIQAFLIVWEYAVQQDVNDERVHVRRVNAARMDPATLGTLVYEQRMLERLQASPAELTEAQITQLTDMGFSREHASEQLTLTGGIAERAIEQLTNEGANNRPTSAASFTPQDEDVQALMAVGNFSREDVVRELTRSRGDRNEAMVRLFDQMTTGTPPTNTRAKSPPPQSVTRAEPPGTELGHPYDEEDIGRLMSYRNISAEVVVRELDRAEGNIEVAEERIRHLSQALSSTSGSRSNSGRDPGNGPSSKHSSSHSRGGPDSDPPKGSSTSDRPETGPESRPSKKRDHAHPVDGADNEHPKKRLRTQSGHKPDNKLSRKTSKSVSNRRSSSRLSKSTDKHHSGDGLDDKLSKKSFKRPHSNSEDCLKSKHPKRTSKSGSTEELDPESSKNSSDPDFDDGSDAGPSKRRSDSDSSQGPDTKPSKATAQSRRKGASSGSQETNRNPTRHPDQGPGPESSNTNSHTSANRLSYSGSAMRPYNWAGYRVKARNSSFHSRIDNIPQHSKAPWYSRSRRVATPGLSKTRSHPQFRRDVTSGTSSAPFHGPPTQNPSLKVAALPANRPITNEEIDKALTLWHQNFNQRRELIAITPFERGRPAWEYQGRIIGRMIGNEARGIALMAANVARNDGQENGSGRSEIDIDLKYQVFSGCLLENVLDAKRGALVATDTKASKKIKTIDLEDYDVESNLEEIEDPDAKLATIDLVDSNVEQEADDVKDSDAEQEAEGMDGPETEAEIIDLTKSSVDFTDDYGFEQKPISHDGVFPKYMKRAIETMTSVARRPLPASYKAPATPCSAAAVQDSVFHLGTSSASQKPVDPRLEYSSLIDPRLNKSKLGSPSAIDPRLINPSTSEEFYTTSIPETPPPRSVIHPRLGTSSASNDFHAARIPTAPPPRPYCSLQRAEPLPEEDIETLVAIGHSRKEAFRALDLYQGDLAQAMYWLG